MTLSKKSPEQLLGIAEMAFNVAKNDERFKAPLQAYKIDDARVDEYIAIFQDAKTKYQDFVNERGEQFEATAEVTHAVEKASPVYIEHVTLVRMMLKNNIEKQKRYAVRGQRKKDIYGWIQQAEIFYCNLLANEELLADLEVRYGLTREKLEQGQQLILQVKAATAKQQVEISESQQARVEKDRALSYLRTVLGDFFQVCKFAHRDNPQVLERAGIKVYSENYKPKVKTTPPVTQEEPGETGETGETQPAE